MLGTKIYYQTLSISKRYEPMSEEKKSSYECHLFICTSCRYSTGNNEYCAPELASQMRKSLKEKLKGEYPKDKVRINSAGCLGHCDRGINAVIYPSGEWFHDLTEKDEDLLIGKVKEIMG